MLKKILTAVLVLLTGPFVRRREKNGDLRSFGDGQRSC
jgi:hypothetical protein